MNIMNKQLYFTEKLARFKIYVNDLQLKILNGDIKEN